MSLPVLESPKYELTIPSTKKKLQYRPYLVKEEKILLLAMESKDNGQIVRALLDVIESCTFNKVKGEDLTVFDLEYIFVQIRSQSVGEGSDIKYPCDSCEKSNDIHINLSEVGVVGVSDKKKIIKLTDTVGITLKYPTMKDVKTITDNEKLSDSEKALKMIISSIDTIYDAEKIYQSSEYTFDQLSNFVDSFNSKQFEELKTFVEDSPKLSHTKEFTCSSCGHENKVVFEGLASFF